MKRTSRWMIIGTYIASLLVMEAVLMGYLHHCLGAPYPQKAGCGLFIAVGISIAVAMLFPVILNHFKTRSTAKSLRDMAAAASRIGGGEAGVRIPVLKEDETGYLAREMNDMVEKVEGRLAALAAEKNRLDIILRGMGEGVMVTDASGVITMVNPAFRALFSTQGDEEKRPFIEIVRHPALHEAFKTVMKTCCERLDEMTLQLNKEASLLIHWAPLLENNEIRGIVAVFHDISELKRLEKVRRDFVANVSHELRTPVTVIKGYAETLMSGAMKSDPERGGKFVEIIHSHAERLATLIGDLLALSELESGDIALELAPISISSAIRRSCILLEQKARDKDITIEWSGIDGAPPIMADPGRIEQVLINLLDNAIKYTPEKGSVRISANEAGQMMQIEVADTGIGIPPQDQPRIFERFYRVNKARSRDQGGTGLGLSIVKHILQLHGGAVWVESTPGKGSTFSFTLRKASPVMATTATAPELSQAV